MLVRCRSCGGMVWTREFELGYGEMGFQTKKRNHHGVLDPYIAYVCDSCSKIKLVTVGRDDPAADTND